MKEQELQQVQRSWSASSQQEGSVSGETERAKLQVKALEGQLRDLHSRLTRLQADTRYPQLAHAADPTPSLLWLGHRLAWVGKHSSQPQLQKPIALLLWSFSIDLC